MRSRSKHFFRHAYLARGRLRAVPEARIRHVGPRHCEELLFSGLGKNKVEAEGCEIFPVFGAGQGECLYAVSAQVGQVVFQRAAVVVIGEAGGGMRLDGLLHLREPLSETCVSPDKFPEPAFNGQIIEL